MSEKLEPGTKVRLTGSEWYRPGTTDRPCRGDIIEIEFLGDDDDEYQAYFHAADSSLWGLVVDPKFNPAEHSCWGAEIVDPPVPNWCRDEKHFNEESPIPAYDHYVLHHHTNHDPERNRKGDRIGEGDLIVHGVNKTSDIVWLGIQTSSSLNWVAVSKQEALDFAINLATIVVNSNSETELKE